MGSGVDFRGFYPYIYGVGKGGHLHDFCAARTINHLIHSQVLLNPINLKILHEFSKPLVELEHMYYNIRITTRWSVSISPEYVHQSATSKLSYFWVASVTFLREI
jgi:hypothetical protein